MSIIDLPIVTIICVLTVMYQIRHLVPTQRISLLPQPDPIHHEQDCYRVPSVVLRILADSSLFLRRKLGTPFHLSCPVIVKVHQTAFTWICRCTSRGTVLASSTRHCCSSYAFHRIYQHKPYIAAISTRPSLRKTNRPARERYVIEQTPTPMVYVLGNCCGY